MLFRSLYTAYLLIRSFGAAMEASLPPDAGMFPSRSLDCLASTLPFAPEIAKNFKLLCAHPKVEKALADCVQTSCSFPDRQKVARINSNLCTGQPVQSKAILGTVVFGIMGTITQVTIALRLYSRRKLASALSTGLDDYLILWASMVIFYTQVTGTIQILVFGFGRHIFNVDPKNDLPVLLLYWSDEIAYQILMPLVKCSILFFYLRLFVDPRFRALCYGMIAFTIATGLTFGLVTLLQCNPTRGVFDKSIESKCLDNNAATFTFKRLFDRHRLHDFTHATSTAVQTQSSQEQEKLCVDPVQLWILGIHCECYPTAIHHSFWQNHRPFL